MINECPNLKPAILRPGFIWDKQHRWWSVPLHYAVDLLWHMGELQKGMPYFKYTDFLYPAKSVRLDTVTHFAIEGVLGNLGEDKIF
jgi:hypothetical protein